MEAWLVNQNAKLGLCVGVVLLLAELLVQVCFAIAVYVDARKQASKGPGSLFVRPAIWGLAALLGGVFVAAVYWAMHHSQLCRTEPVANHPEPCSYRTLPPDPDRPFWF